MASLAGAGATSLPGQALAWRCWLNGLSAMNAQRASDPKHQPCGAGAASTAARPGLARAPASGLRANLHIVYKTTIHHCHTLISQTLHCMPAFSLPSSSLPPPPSSPPCCCTASAPWYSYLHALDVGLQQVLAASQQIWKSQLVHSSRQQQRQQRHPMRHAPPAEAQRLTQRRHTERASPPSDQARQEAHLPNRHCIPPEDEPLAQHGQQVSAVLRQPARPHRRCNKGGGHAAGGRSSIVSHGSPNPQPQNSLSQPPVRAHMLHTIPPT